MEMALNLAPKFVPLPEDFIVTVEGEPPAGEVPENVTRVLQLPEVVDYTLDTVTATATNLQPFMSFSGSTLQLKLVNIDYTNAGNYTFVVLLED